MSRIAILGATSGPGASLLLRLMEQGEDVIGIGRDTQKMEQLNKETQHDLRWHACDIADVAKLKVALTDVSIVVNCSNPSFVTQILEAAGDHLKRLITLGSTRIYTKFPDERAAYVQKAQEDAFASGIPSTVLHPTLIYGWRGNNNIRRIVDLVRWFRFIPLPRGGRSLVQPIHSEDVVACLESALRDPATAGSAFVIAGPEPLTYADFVRESAKASHLTARIFSIPLSLAYFLGRLTRVVPGIPSVGDMEIKRLLEDKAFDITDMKNVLKVTPRKFRDGLRHKAL